MNAILEGINLMGRAFVEFAGPMLVQSSVLIAILLAGDFLLRRKVRAVLRYWLWMLVLVKLVLPISLTTPVSLGQWFGERLEYVQREHTPAVVSPRPIPRTVETMQEFGQVEVEPIKVSGERLTPSPVTEFEPIAAESGTEASVAITPVTWQGWVFLGWLAVVAAMGLLLVQRAIFVLGLVAQARGVNGLMGDTLKYCCGRMGVRGKIGLKVSANATSSAVCGLFRPVILVPQDLGPNLGAAGLRVVLMHELAHIRRGDLWVNLVQTVLQIVYFYNPLLWVANAVIRRVREQAVDEAVQVAMGEKAGEYPETLVRVAKLAFERPALSLRLIGVVESKSTLQSRVKRMLEQPLPKSAKLGFLGLIAILVVGAILLPMAKGENLTHHARKAMKQADQEARQLNHEYIGTEHILLALVGDGRGIVATILKNVDVDIEKVRPEVGKFVKSGSSRVKKRKLPQTPRAKKVMTYAEDEARSLNHDCISGEHILLALLSVEDGVGGQVLMNLGAKYGDVRQEVLELVGPGPIKGGHPTLVISGTVKDSATGLPIAGAKVGDEHYLDGVRSTLTRSDGGYTYLTWPEHHGIKAESGGYKTQRESLYSGHFDFGKEEVEEVINFNLEPESVSQASGFKKTLPNGVRIELVGVCEFTPSGQLWWKPNGTIFYPEISISNKEDYFLDDTYAFVYETDKPTIIDFQNIDGMIKFEGRPWLENAKRSHYRRYMFIRNYKTHYYVTAKIKFDNRKTTTHKLNVLPAWKTVAEYDGKYVLGSQNPKVDFFETYNTAQGIKVVLDHRYEGYKWRLVAIIPHEHHEEQVSGSDIQAVSSVEGDKRRAVIFKDSKLEDISRFEFQIREGKENEVVFKNVSLKPNFKTDVQVEVEKPAVGVEGEAEILSKFFSYVDIKIEQLVPDYPQFVEWDVKKTEPQWWRPGKMLTAEELVYNHSLSPSKSSNYRDWYGQNGCHIRISVFTEEEWNRLEGPGIKTEIFGLRMGQFFVVATVITEKPEVPELEQKINDIIRSAVINTNQNPDVQVEGPKSSWLQVDDQAPEEVLAIGKVLKKWFDACLKDDFEQAKKIHHPERIDEAEHDFKETIRILEIVPDEPFTILTFIGDDKAAYVAAGTQNGTVFFGEPVVIGFGFKKFEGQWRVGSAGGTKFERLQQFITQSKENNPNIKIWPSDSYSKLASQTDTIFKKKAEAFDKTTWNQLDGAPEEVQDIADVLRRWYKSCLAANLEEFKALYTPNSKFHAEKELKELRQYGIIAPEWQFSPMVIRIGDSRAEAISHDFVISAKVPEYSGDPVVIIVQLMKVNGQWGILGWSGDSLRSISHAHFERKYPQSRIWFDKSIPDWLKPNQKTNTDVTIGDIKSSLPETKTEETLTEKLRELNNDRVVFESYFPDSNEGGRALDDWWKVKDKEQRTDEEIFNIIRNGLRRTGDGKLRDHRDRFTGWVGQKYIWKKGPKNKQAVELMYYASFDPELTANTVYYGLSVAGEEQNPKVLERLVDICMSNIYVTRILWGTKGKYDQMTTYLEPYLNSSDLQLSERAVILEKTFKGEIDYGQWEKEQHREKRQQEFGDKLPAIRELLLNGNSEQRLETFDLIRRRGLYVLLDDSFKEPLIACLKDDHPVVKEAALRLSRYVLLKKNEQSPEIFELMSNLSKDWDHKVRNESAKSIGSHWIWGAKPQKPEPIEIMLRLSKDKDRGVRYQAVYYGLSVVENKDESIIKRLVEMALDKTSDFGRISWGLSRGADEEIIKKYLIPHLTHESTKAKLARKLYRELFKEEPPEVKRKPTVQVESKEP